MSIPKKPRKCRVCKKVFQPVRCLQSVCGPECAITQAKAKRAKSERIAGIEDRKVVKYKLDKLKTARDWTKEAQIAFNAFIRERDKGQPCICCGQSLSSGDIGGQYDCGHYRSVGSAPHLRFDPRNAHAQRKKCNRWGAGRAVDYRLGLISRIGKEAVESLESDQTPRKYTIEELKSIKAHYIAKTKELRK
jgi:hypothetical protein